MAFTLQQLIDKADAVAVDGARAVATFGADEISVKIVDDKLDLQPARSSQHRRLIEYLTAL